MAGCYRLMKFASSHFLNLMCVLPWFVCVSVCVQRANKGTKAAERLRKKLSEQESLLLLASPNMALRVHNRNGKVRRHRHGNHHGNCNTFLFGSRIVLCFYNASVIVECFASLS